MSDAPTTALRGVLAQWDARLGQNPARLAKMLRRGAKHTELWWTSKEIHAPLPSSLRALLTWHDGEAKSSTIINADFRASFPDYFLVHSERGAARFMDHVAIARAGATDAELTSDSEGTFASGAHFAAAHTKNADSTLAARIALKLRARAIERVVLFFTEDEGIDEVFVDDDILRTLVDEFL